MPWGAASSLRASSADKKGLIQTLVNDMQLETDRLLLRQFQADDIDAYAEMVADEEAMRFVGGVGDKADAWRRMAKWAGQWVLRGYGEFAIEEKATGTFIGLCGPYYPADWPQVELGWQIARPSWGCGYAPEAARVCAQWMFGELGFPRIISMINPENAASIRVAEKIGERSDGTFVSKGEELLIYAMSKHDLVLDP